MKYQEKTIHEDPSLVRVLSDRAFLAHLSKKLFSAWGTAFLRFTCPSSRFNEKHINEIYINEKKKYLRAKMLTAVFTSRRETYSGLSSEFIPHEEKA